MGCDIHWAIEVRQEDGSWECVFPRLGWSEATFTDSETGEDYTEQFFEDQMSWEECKKHPLCVGRWYSLFGALADVRTCAGITPISRPRGVPVDVSDPVAMWIKEYDEDAHSASWLSLQEMVEVFKRDEHKREILANFMKTLEAMQQLGEVENVRAVFFFDC